MLEAMREVRGKIGMNPEEDSEDEEESMFTFFCNIDVQAM